MKKWQKTGLLIVWCIIIAGYFFIIELTIVPPPFFPMSQGSVTMMAAPQKFTAMANFIGKIIPLTAKSRPE